LNQRFGVQLPEVFASWLHAFSDESVAGRLQHALGDVTK
jgi:hypothetical protein